MTWYDTKQAAVDPDNPAANEQFPFSEHNAMVTYLKDKIVNKTVNTAAIGNDKVLVYKTATSTFVFETQSAVAAINDLTDVTISGVPADNEVLAYNDGTSKWINQTAAEAGLATVAGLAVYYPLSGATLTGNMNVGDYQINGLDDLQAYDTSGIILRDNGGVLKLRVSTTSNAFIAYDECYMSSHKIAGVADPTDAQDAATKNYSDTRLFSKEVVITPTSFTDGYTPVYRTSSGKFEMESQSTGTAVLEADYNANTFLYALADNTPLPKTSAEVMAILSGTASAEFLFNTQKIGGIVDPTTAQQAATKNYSDTRLFSKEVVITPTSFTDGYTPVYRTSSGKFEMESQGASAGLPVSDSTSIVKGSADSTKQMRFEVDGLTAITTRIMTVPDKDMTLCGTDDALLLNGANAMANNLDLGGMGIDGLGAAGKGIFGATDNGFITIKAGTVTENGATIALYGDDNVIFPGLLSLQVPNAAKTSTLTALSVAGVSNAPKVRIGYGLDMNDTVITDPKNSAASALSGTQKDIEIDIGGTPYYFTVYPTKA